MQRQSSTCRLAWASQADCKSVAFGLWGFESLLAHSTPQHLRDRNGRTDLVLTQGIPVRIRAGVLGDVIRPARVAGGPTRERGHNSVIALTSDPAVFIRAGRLVL